MLTRALLDFTLIGAEWVLWLLVILSILSVALMIERTLYFAKRGHRPSAGLMKDLREADLEGARKRLGEVPGMVGDVLRAGIAAAPKGAASVEATLLGEIATSRQGYERFLSFLGTLGNNAPFIGLFGTVLGIIRAFADLAAAGAGGGPDVVMAGISEALVATAVGLFVALPAVAAFNVFARWQKRITSDATSAGQALLAGLKAEKH
ncbi:MAG: MotA/TolQ/ExbB proton channel family protein [Deltaproteobacteria bacterium]|nr:MotA/TolQ/ExbB proton channel family protein [Deltaproteobacteria bacterium]